MRSSFNRQFSLKERFLYIAYRFSRRIQDRVPKNLPGEYSFFFSLFGKGGSSSRKGEFNLVKYTINSNPVQVLIRRNSSDMEVFGQIIFEEEYKEIVSLLNKYAIKTNIIVDAGCNIGLTTLYLKSYFPSARFVCIEPSDSNRKVLEENIRYNSFKDVRVESRGLWSKSCFLKVRDFRDNKEWSFSLEEADKDAPGAIEAISLQQLITNYELPGIDFLKIDVEGAEKNIFLEDPNIGEWLSKVKVIAIEIHDEFNCRQNIESILRSSNFELHFSGELTIGINKSILP